MGKTTSKCVPVRHNAIGVPKTLHGLNLAQQQWPESIKQSGSPDSLSQSGRINIVKHGFNKYVIWLLLLLSLLWCNSAAAWWNEDWQYRQKIHIDTTTSGADIKENLMDVPVLIRLHTGNFNFNNAQSEGGDLRFVTSDDTQLLKHHIERFDIIDEMALIWVKLPRLSAQTNQEFIWLYYGNGEAVGGQDAKATYDNAYAAVFHFSEIEGPPQDATANGQEVLAFSGGLGLPGVIDGSLTLNGTSDRLQINPSPSLSFDSGMTFSAWVRINQEQADAYLLQIPFATGEMVVGIDGTNVYCRLSESKDQVIQTEKNTSLSLGQWHHLMVSAAPGQRLIIYLDGLEMFFTAVNLPWPAFDRGLILGSAVVAGHGYAGDLDEIEISTIARSASWARSIYTNQGPEGLLCGVGVEEAGGGGGMPLFYIATIMKNITLDGWLIIGLLIALAVVSWLIFLNKTFSIWIAEKENRAFSAAFRQMADPVADYHSENGYHNSHLYRVYATGCENIREEDHRGRPAKSNGALKIFKAALEEGYILENKRLNAYMVVLTMAISGGPFLGLLGTVWGVMNTFAAMAEAGEANIMAIAPGVASALSTTVFGLIVAIPALFGYNFLASRIKSITADMAVFIDQLNLKVERHFGGEA